MSNAKLIKALRNCVTPMAGSCEKCSYYGVDCRWNLMIDAADALEAADEKIADYTAAIDALDDSNDAYIKENERLKKRIAELEARLPKEGEWIVTTEVSDDGADTSHINCSRCGFYWREPKHGKVFKRCPNCGSRMRTVTDCHTLEEGER